MQESPKVQRQKNGEFRLECALWLPRPREEVFGFFADAANLDRLTPPFLSFSIVTPMPVDMKEGALIDYRLRLYGLPLKWRTEISRWDPPGCFVDTQIRGPYRKWVHRHTFAERDGETLCRDEVDYSVPGGALINRFFVQSDVEKIFEFRQKKLKELFGG